MIEQPGHPGKVKNDQMVPFLYLKPNAPGIFRARFLCDC